jgi:DNA-binding transcriptional regulator WhiA
MKKIQKIEETKVHETKNVENEKRPSYSEVLFEKRESVMKSLGIMEDFMVDEIKNNKK